MFLHIKTNTLKEIESVEDWGNSRTTLNSFQC